MQFNRLVWAAMAFSVADAAGTAGAVESVQPSAIEIVEVETVAEPMIYVTSTTSMTGVAAFMGTAFSTLGQFIGANRIVPAGPPLAIYHDWTETQTVVDVGFPVTAADAAKSQGGVLAGTTPGGLALKAIHRGPYSGMPGTYAAIAARMAKAGIPPATVMWEVYVSDPDTTPEAELVTEIYTRIAPADSGKMAAAKP